MKILSTNKNTLSSLEKVDIKTSEDLVYYLPYRYDSFYYDSEEEIYDKKRLVLYGTLSTSPKLSSSSNYEIVTFFFKTEKGNLYPVIAFGRPYLKRILNTFDEWTLVGTYDEKKKQINLVNIKKGRITKEEELKPIYHLPSSLKQSTYCSLLKRTIERKEVVFSLLPEMFRKKYRLLDENDALTKIHFPRSEEDIYLAQRTLKYEECLEFCLKNRIIRDTNKSIIRKNKNAISFIQVDKYINSLPFRLSKDQITASREIINDMNSESIMYRLIQGDVGSGKTVVASVSLYANYLRGFQGVLMVPTDSLARQHFESIKAFMEPFSINVELLTSTLSSSEKRRVKKSIKEGVCSIIIGTHAVFSKDVEYFNLGLAIVDEQHRFGVNQRNLLASKGDYVDLLLMSATPIPRTLSLSIFGDLDVSTIKEFPNKKREVITRVCDYDSDRINGLIALCLSANRQVFMVCPKIEKGVLETKSAEEIYEKYKTQYKSKIALLHGKMDNNEKIEILDKFRRNEINILVATTVVELGIDIKTAGGIIIFSANSFGLSSLHQLRGRVGRDGKEAYCLLVDHFETREDSSRLKLLENTLDGFEIAEQDMKLRGPGDMLGVMQSGFPTFSVLNIVNDFKMFEIARDDASYIVHNLDETQNLVYYNYVLDKMKKSEEQMTLFD